MPWAGAARASATAAAPPAVLALTVPTPVITTRRRSRWAGVGAAGMSVRRAPEDQAHVLAAEPEGVRDRGIDVGGPGHTGHAVERDRGVALGEIRGGRDQGVLQREDGRDRLDAARR